MVGASQCLGQAGAVEVPVVVGAAVEVGAVVEVGAAVVVGAMSATDKNFKIKKLGIILTVGKGNL